MIKSITCGKCSRGVGWYDTKFYNVIKPAIAVGIFVLVAVFDCECGGRVKFDGIQAKKRANKANREVRAIAA